MKSQRDLGIINMAQFMFMFWSEWRKSNFNLSDLYYLLFLFYEKKIRVHLLHTAGTVVGSFLVHIIDLAFRRLGKGTLNSRIDGIKKNPLKKMSDYGGIKSQWQSNFSSYSIKVEEILSKDS